MLRLEWNALRAGDEVVVHDPGDPGMRLLPGVVTMVQTAKDSNDIGIRVASPGGACRYSHWLCSC